MKDFTMHLVDQQAPIREALRLLSGFVEEGSRTLFAVDTDQRVTGTVTDGDIRRGFLNGNTIDDRISAIMETRFISLPEKAFTVADVRAIREKGVTLLPQLDADRKVIRVFNLAIQRSILPLDAVIMAGGKGLRLGVLTRETPKPLLKVGDRSILEHNLNLLSRYGITSVHLAVNFLAEKIIEHFKNDPPEGITLNYIHEEEPMGTVGALSRIGIVQNEHLLLMNADLLTNINLEDFYSDFIEQDADMAVACVPYHVMVPYAVIELDGDRSVASVNEKPTFTHYSNAGIYLLKKRVLELIPASGRYDATDLMSELIKKKRKVVSFPILGYWLDIGRIEDYEKAQHDFKHIGS